MVFEIDLNEVPAGTCGACGGERGTERECICCVPRQTQIDDINLLPLPNHNYSPAPPPMYLVSDVLGRSDTAQIPNANFLHLGTSVNMSRASRGVIQSPHLITEYVASPPKRGRPPSTNLNLVMQGQSEVYLRALREYINQKRGFLIDGWSVDFFYCQSRCKTSAVYCSPEGSRFVCMEDVEKHLGSQEHHPLQTESMNDFALNQRRLHTSQVGKQSLQFASGNRFRENQDTGSALFQDPFPFQFEDLFILSSGLIDPRPTYHNSNQIWPVGYKSCWHDRITGSIFLCDVLEGGDAGPTFRVRRHSCSDFPIPVGFTVLSRKNPIPCNGKEKVSNNCSSSNKDIDKHDDEILSFQMLLKEDLPPNIGEMNFQKTSSLNTESQFASTKPEELGDCIGALSVESKSTLSAWEMVSKALLKACHVAYKQTGRLRFCCKHNVDRVSVAGNIPDSLLRFCSWSGPTDNISQPIVNDNEFEACTEVLTKWLQQDRFGLDMEFVHEILEHLPNVQACSGYSFLNKRGQSLGMQTVQHGFLDTRRKSDALPDGYSLSWKRPRGHLKDTAPRKSFPLGKPFSKLPPSLVGDVLQGWEFLWRFSEILGLEEPISFETIENELIHPWSGTRNPENSGIEMPNWDVTSCTGVTLRKANISLLKAIVSELVLKVAAYLNPFCEVGESNPRTGKKKENESSSVKKIEFDMLQINEFTWPELARRYILVFLSLEGKLDSTEINISVARKIFHGLQGDGGILCGSVTGVSGMEADAFLLAEARKQVFGLPKNNEVLNIEQPKPEEIRMPRFTEVNDDEIPEWAQVLEPVRKLPTNVGARLKKCVIHALELNPPEWAKNILEHSISKEVYKGNASGPTKRAVVSLLSEISSKATPIKGISSKILQPKPVKKETSEGVKTFSDLLMKQCRIVLRRAAAEDAEKVFCTLLGKTLYLYDNDDEGFLGSSSTVSRPLDFRMIDFRLAAGAYSGSHEAFLEDVCEMWNNIRSIYSDRPDLVEVVETLSKKFKDLYEEEVLLLAQKLPENSDSVCINDEAKRHMDAQFVKVMESSLPKAPWEEGVCKVCGVDRDDDNVLLCDGCDSEYHTYCLNPPLARIPDGNWYCPSCIAGRYKSRGPSRGVQVTRFRRKRIQGEFTQQLMDKLSQLAQSMASKEYWNFNAEERAFLFKFLCDETLNTSILRNHVGCCASESVEEQPQLSSSKSKCISDKSPAGNKKQKHKVPTSSDQVQEQQQGKVQNQEELPDTIDDLSVESSNKSKTNVLENNNSNVNSVKHGISVTLESVSCVDSELEKMSIRKDILGRDTGGRVYWGFRRPGTCSLLVDRSLEHSYENNFGRSNKFGLYHPLANHAISGWSSYQNDDEISEIVEWLSCGEVRDRELRDSILQWQRSKSKYENLAQNGKELFCSKLPRDANATPSILVTKAAAVLEKRYGPCLEWDPAEMQGNKGTLCKEGRMHRCTCLELVWNSKHHCVLCHKTLSTSEELEIHFNRNCNNQVDKESLKGKKIASEPSRLRRPDGNTIGKGVKESNKPSFTKSKSQRPDCPYDLKEISSTFVTQDSLRELIRSIGFIASSGNPSFVPRPLVFQDPTLRVISENIMKYGTGLIESNNRPQQSRERTSNSYNFPRSLENDRGEGNSKVVDLTSNSMDIRDPFETQRHRRFAGGNNRCVIPESSFRRLDSKETAILRQLKMSLLDIDDSLPEEALRLSTSPHNRVAWRAFVKGAASIYEMVQASIVLENMIRADYLRREWWYSSSLTAAASISTLSALALRLCTLGAAIIYEKPSPSDPTQVSGANNKENERTALKSLKGKEKASPSRPSESMRQKGKNKRKRESGLSDCYGRNRC